MDRKGGAIRGVRGSPFPAGNGPVAVVPDWSDEYLYVVNAYSHAITQFKIEDDGRLRPMGDAIAAGLGPVNIVAQRGLSTSQSPTMAQSPNPETQSTAFGRPAFTQSPSIGAKRLMGERRGTRCLAVRNQ